MVNPQCLVKGAEKPNKAVAVAVEKQAQWLLGPLDGEHAEAVPREREVPQHAVLRALHIQAEVLDVGGSADLVQNGGQGCGGDGADNVRAKLKGLTFFSW